MICDKCGATMPEGIKFCSACGNVLTQPAQPPVYQQPAYQMPVSPYPQQPLSRGKFIGSQNGPKGLALGSMLVLFACALLIGLCLYLTLCGPISSIPALDAIFTLAGEDIDVLDETFEEGQKIMDKSREDLENAVDLYGEGLNKEEKKAVKLGEDLLDQADKAMESKSFKGLRDVIAALLEVNEELEDLDIGYHGLDESDHPDFEAILETMDTVILVLAILYGVGILFAVLAGIFKNNILTVLGMLSSFGLCLTLSNALLAILLLALFIVAIVLNAKISGKYKAYKRSMGF